MGLVVQTNNAATTALKHLNTNNTKMNQALERLSSGFRVNSAADDAAGFAISSKLDAQAGRLKAAATNVAQAQAMVKTADAGVNEIQNMVSRLQVLATQAESANNDGERNRLDGERSKLESAIDKIASSTKYNGVSLLDGTAGVTVASNTFTTAEGLSGVSLDGATASTTYTASLVLASGSTTTAAFASGDKITLTDGTTSQTVTVTTAPSGLNTLDVNFGNLGITLTINSAIVGQTAVGAGTAIGNVVTSAAAANTFQVGADNNANNRIDVAFNNSYSTTGLSITGDITTVTNARAYADVLTTALSTVTTNRATLGATQNQLSYVGANLATSVEQISAAVSTIRDADMAAEMANFTKSQILVQAGTAMLAQANQASQNVLTLFR